MQEAAMDRARLETMLLRMRKVSVLVVGDVCLDAYWMADMRLSQLSRETPHHNLPVVEERYALGGAGNVMANMRALGAQVWPVTVLGRDWRGQLVQKMMDQLGLKAQGLTASEGRVTPSYVKPYRMGYGGARSEDPRLDFENHTPLDGAEEERVAQAIRAGAQQAQVIAVSDQMAAGVVSGGVRRELIRQAEAGKTVVVDSREHIAGFRGCIIKPNELESARAAGMAPRAVTPQDYEEVARRLHELTGGSVVITLGGAGSMCLSGGKCFYAPATRVAPPIDIVGAGDSFLSACALALGAGAQLWEAIVLGNLASAVTIQKLGQTGTASAEEILALWCAKEKGAGPCAGTPGE